MSQSVLNGSQILLKVLIEQGVDVVFGYPGGAVLPLYDELFKQDAVRHVLVRHEQGAVHAAEGYARSTGKVGVVLVTSGPGATNTVTGLTDALLDSTPIVCLTGQVPTNLIGNDAFQEADTTGITRACTKHNYLVKDINELARILHEAFYVARSGRPGPVLVDLPKDVLIASGPYFSPRKVYHKSYHPKTDADPAAINEAVQLMVQAKRPLFYCGGGVVNSGQKATHCLTHLVRETHFPVTLTLMGLGAVPASDQHFLGMVGMHGTYEANMAMHDCDLMLCIGARFDDRVTGKVTSFSPYSRKVHVDIDPSSINKNVMVDVPVLGDAANVLNDILEQWRMLEPQPEKSLLIDWWGKIEEWRSVHCLSFEETNRVIKPQRVIRSLYEATLNRDVYVCTEVGQHQMWTAQHFGFEKPRRWMTSGGLGTMGFGLPAAVGVQMAHPQSLVVNIAGEASIMMNIQEMATAVQYRLPLKVFIMNNRYMGMVRQWQELLYEGRYSESYSATLPNFVKLADAFGWTGLQVTQADRLDEIIQIALDTQGPVIVDIVVDPSENCFPMIPAGAAHNEILLGPTDKGRRELGSEEGMILV